MVSLKQIAKELGVSYSLVSKVLNGRLGTTGVSEDTRIAIEKKARELNYIPNRLAVALKSGRQGTIGVFLHQMGTPGSEVSQRLLSGIADELHRRGIQMWLRFFSSDEEFLAACDDPLQNKVDGLIVAGVRHAELISKLQDFDKKGLPVVSVFSDLPKQLRAKIVNVGVDWEEQGFIAVKHLIDQGCSKIATFSSNKHRHNGYIAAHRAAKMRMQSKQVVSNVDYSLEGGEEAMNMLLSRKVEFDGLFCECDAQAVGAINGLRRQGTDLWKRIKIIGIDNSPLADACVLPLSSVTPEMTQSGKAAATLLFDKIEGQAIQSKLIQPKLVVRESTR